MRPWVLLPALATVLGCGVLIGGFAANTRDGVDSSTYHVAFKGASWVRAGTPAPRSWFRLSFAVSTRPAASVLWTDADQDVNVWINGHPVTDGLGQTRGTKHLETHGYDLGSEIRIGANTVGLEVVNADHRPAAVRARLAIDFGPYVDDLLTGRAAWQSTSDVALVTDGKTMSSRRFVALGWQPPISVARVRGDVGSQTPEWLLGNPLSGGVIAAPEASSRVTVTAPVRLDQNPSDAWLRVAATGEYSLSVNGQDIVLPRPGTLSWRSTSKPRNAAAYHITPFLHAGQNELTVRASSASVAAVYVDGRIDVGGRSVWIRSGRGWAVDGRLGTRTARPEAPIVLGSPQAVWGKPLTVARTGASALDTPPSFIVLPRLEWSLAAVALWVTAGGLAAGLARRPLPELLGIAAAGYLPSGACVLLTEQIGRLPSVDAPGMHTQPVLLALAALVPIGVGASLLALVYADRLPRPVPWRQLPRVPKLFAFSAERGLLRPAVGAVGWCLAGGLTLLERAIAQDSGPGAYQLHNPALMRWRRRYVAGVVLITLVMLGLLSYDVGYEYYWQDELDSIDAARGIRAHLLPLWPSGFAYWKGELFSVVIAMVGGITGDNAGPLRYVSVGFYGLTILAFGIVLVPAMLRHRHPAVWLATTLLFATAPAEIGWAREVRMYQMAQFFFVVFLGVFLTALRAPTWRRITVAAVAALGMYLSHEETFIVLPAVAAVAIVALRSRAVFDRRWLLAAVVCGVMIAGQYLLAMASHPPIFGYDHSNRPFIQPDTRSAYYYLSSVYFSPSSGSLAVVSTLAVVATIVGVATRSSTRLYLASFLWGPVLVLSFLFTPVSSRYTFITMPPLFLLGMLGFLDLLGLIRRALSLAAGGELQRRVIAAVSILSSVPGLLALVATMPSNTGSYGLAVARLTRSPVASKNVDYQYVTEYLKRHQEAGDIFITIAPPNLPAYYLGRPPDMIITTRSRDRLLFIYEKNGRAVDTEFGVPVILAPQDLEHVLETHRRVWLVTDDSRYLRRLPPGFPQLIQPNFRLVDQGVSADLYLFGGD